MKNLFILGNGFDIDLGLNTAFKAFRESYEFQSIADIPLIKKIRDYQWNDIEGKLREELIAYSKNPSEEYAKSINDAWIMLTKHWGIYLPELTDLDKINIDKKSCAYQLLELMKDVIVIGIPLTIPILGIFASCKIKQILFSCTIKIHL